MYNVHSFILRNAKSTRDRKFNIHYNIKINASILNILCFNCSIEIDPNCLCKHIRNTYEFNYTLLL